MSKRRIFSFLISLLCLSSFFVVGAHAEGTVVLPSYTTMIDALWAVISTLIPIGDTHTVVIVITLCMLVAGIALILFPAKLVKHFYILLLAILGFSVVYGARGTITDLLPFLSSTPVAIYILAAVVGILFVVLALFLFRVSLLVGVAAFSCFYVAPCLTLLFPVIAPFSIPIALVIGVLIGYVFAFVWTKVFYVILSSVSSAVLIAFSIVTMAEQLLLDAGMLPTHIDALLWIVAGLLFVIALAIRFFDKRRKEAEHWEP